MKKTLIIINIPLRMAFILMLLLWTTFSLNAIKPDTLFRSEEIIRMELRSDFSWIIGDRTEFQEYQDAELIYFVKGKKTVSLKVMIMIRGNFRRNPDNCEFPPLLINFKKAEVRNTVFENQEKIKLVTPCRNEEDLIDEYTIYKMYNKVTDLSLRTRLIKMTYFDTGKNKKLFEKYSFFLEDADRAASRVNASVSKMKVSTNELDRENFKKMSVFQYMMGNLDWNIEMGKNIILFRPDDASLNTCAVPYDFDFSAFVDAEYSVTSGLREDNIKSRRKYQGICFNKYELISTLDLFRKLRPSFEALINDQRELSSGARRKLISFLNGSYEEAADEDSLFQIFQNVCQDGLPASRVSN